MRDAKDISALEEKEQILEAVGSLFEPTGVCVLLPQESERRGGTDGCRNPYFSILPPNNEIRVKDALPPCEGDP